MCVECETAPDNVRRLHRHGHIETPEPGILEYGAAGALYGLSGFTVLAVCWLIGTGVDWLVVHVPGIVRFALVASLVGGFTAGIWAKVFADG